MNVKHLISAAACLSALAGCGPYYDHLDFGQQTSPPIPVSLGSSAVTIPVGIAVAVSPIAIDDGGDPMEDSQVSLQSSNASVLGIDPATSDGLLVVYGIRPGQAMITVLVDGERADQIPAVVVEP